MVTQIERTMLSNCGVNVKEFYLFVYSIALRTLLLSSLRAKSMEHLDQEVEIRISWRVEWKCQGAVGAQNKDKFPPFVLHITRIKPLNYLI